MRYLFIILCLIFVLCGCGLPPVQLSINEVGQSTLNEICPHGDDAKANGCCLISLTPIGELWTVFVLDHPSSDVYGRSTLMLGHEIGDCWKKRKGIHTFNGYEE